MSLPDPVVPEGAESRFWAKVERRDDGCWHWQGALTKGYGRISVNGRGVPVHRFAYELLIGLIPEGLQIDHLCRNRACVNPLHLEPVTGRVNVMRGESVPAINARKTHCKDGHLLAGINLGKDKRGQRVCLTCKREASERCKRAKGVGPLRRTSRQVGVVPRPHLGKWEARGPTLDGERQYFGRFDTEEEAIAVVRAARLAAGWPANRRPSVAAALGEAA